MKISVIIPVYNCEKYLERCLNSVLRQRLDDGDELQIITVDDGSTDGSGAILDRYANEHSNIQVIHQSNQGVSAARNHALDVATGDYIHFVDGDDFLLYDNSYQRLLAVLKSGGAPIDVLRINCITFDEHQSIDIEKFRELKEKGISIEFDGSGRDFCHQLLFLGYACISITRRDLIEKLNLRFNTKACIDEDALFFLELYNYAKRVVMTNAAVYGYYRHGESITFTNNKKKLQAVIDNHLENLPLTEKVLNLYDDSYFKVYRLTYLGLEIGKGLLKLPLSYRDFKRYLKRGYDCGLFPLGQLNDESDWKNLKYINWLLKCPFLYWLLSLSYRYVFLPLKPLYLKIA